MSATVLGAWLVPLSRARIDQMLSPIALSSPRHRLRVACVHCGMQIEADRDDDCQHRRVLHCDTANDDRDALAAAGRVA